MGGPRYCVKWRRVGRGMCYNRDGWAEVLCKVETGGPRDCKVETAGPMYYIQWKRAGLSRHIGLGDVTVPSIPCSSITWLEGSCFIYITYLTVPLIQGYR